jgi:hypothetical protein
MAWPFPLASDLWLCGRVASGGSANAGHGTDQVALTSALFRRFAGAPFSDSKGEAEERQILVTTTTAGHNDAEYGCDGGTGQAIDSNASS